MRLRIRRWFNSVEHHVDHGHDNAAPLRKVAIAAVVENPYAGQQVEDLRPMIAASEELGREMGKVLIETIGPYPVQSYGKAGIAGLAGEQEHANALLTTTFANPLREVVGGGKALDFLIHEAGGSLAFRSMFRWRARTRCTFDPLRWHDGRAAGRSVAGRDRCYLLRRQSRKAWRTRWRVEVRRHEGGRRAALNVSRRELHIASPKSLTRCMHHLPEMLAAIEKIRY